MKIPVITLSGPTGAGKTAMALALAERFPVTVINADSRQVYRDFPIITAQPDEAEQACCPHKLYGYLPIDGVLGAGEYARICAPEILSATEQGRIPLLVGGTGLYLKALLEGVAPIPPVDPLVRESLQARCTKEGSQTLYCELEAIDPFYAAKLHPNDRQRITRALEVWVSTGHTFSWWHAQPLAPSPYTILKTGVALPLTELEPLLLQRIHIMLDRGAIDEAKKALELCNDAKAPGWSGIGCREVYDYLEGTVTLEECIELWRKNTRAYAKRQLTWFRAEKEINWFTPGDGVKYAKFVANWLTNRA